MTSSGERKIRIKSSVPNKKVSFSFEGNNEVLNLIQHSGEIVSYLTTQSVSCPINKNTEIRFERILGKGTADAPVWLIKIKGMAEKDYGAKVFTTKLEKKKVEGMLADLSEKYGEKYNVPAQVILAINGGDPTREYFEEKMYIPTGAEKCLTDANKKYKRFDKNGKVLIEKGSYLCESELYSEYPIGVLCGMLYRGLTKVVSKDDIMRVRCINFIDVFGFSTCYDDKNLNQYIFMERTSGSLDNSLELFDVIIPNMPQYKLVDMMVIQGIFALSAMQFAYKLQHNDLHQGNMFFETIKDTTSYHGQSLSDVDFFRYILNGVEIYIPNIGYILKIGDFGLSVKYSLPIIGNKKVMVDGYDQEDGQGPWMPNWYSVAYDMIYVCGGLKSVSRIANQIYTYLKDKIHVKSIINEGMKAREVLNYRPKLSLLNSLEEFSPSFILTRTRLFDNFKVKPVGKKVATIGMIVDDFLVVN